MNESDQPPLTSSTYDDNILDNHLDIDEEKSHGGQLRRRRSEKTGVSRYDSSLGLLTKKFTTLLKVHLKG